MVTFNNPNLPFFALLPNLSHLCLNRVLLYLMFTQILIYAFDEECDVARGERGDFSYKEGKMDIWKGSLGRRQCPFCVAGEAGD
jgi:hypothetical protein